MIITVTAKPGETTGQLTCGDHVFPCALGRTGLTSEKKEGDGATPIGTWPLRRLYFRADRLDPPTTDLPLFPIHPDDGWCDAPQDPAYNTPVRHPYPASAEHLWRDDHLYDITIVLGHNDAPPLPGAGSAIFFHLANQESPQLAPTEGCIALRRADMETLLPFCSPQTQLQISLA